MARYSVNNYTVDTLLSSIKSGSVAIPEMQRPFVWDGTKVRDLIDSLYKGFPVGYMVNTDPFVNYDLSEIFGENLTTIIGVVKLLHERVIPVAA